MIKLLKYTLPILLILSELSFAQFYYFGRNKVQYEDFDWKILRTDHFNIYYYGEMEQIAEIGAKYAEEIYDELKVELNHVVTRRVPLIFYNTSLHFQQTNTTPGFIPDGVGGFFEFLKGRVVIPSTGSLHDFRHVIRHELVHVFMTNKVYRVLRDHRIPPDALPPLWFVEGLAEYLSTEVDAQAEMVMRDAVINGYFFGLQQIYRIYGTFLMYKEGQNFLEFVEDKYGKEKIPLLLENFWMFKNFNKVLEHTIGKSIEEIDNEWEYSLKKKYFPLLEDRVPTYIGADKLTDFGFNFSPSYIEIDEQKFIYFVANRDGYSSVYRIEFDEEGKPSEDPKLILRGEKTEELESFHLFQSSIDISEDGLLAFVTKSGPTDVLHLLSVKTNAIVKTYQWDHLINIASPKFSSNGNMATFQAVDQKGFSDIYTLNLISDSLNRLTNDYFDDRDPSFAENENKIYFSSDRTGGEFKQKYNIYTINRNDHQVEYVTYLNANNFAPVLNNEKTHLFFTSDIDGVRNIWAMNLEDENGNELIKVSSFLTSAFYPAFTDSGDLIFSGFEKFAFNLYITDTEELVVDSADTFVMNLKTPKQRWYAEKLAADTEQEKLDYEKEYSLDFAQSIVTTDPVFGTRGGAVFSLSDLLGDDKYFFLIYNTANVQSDFLKSFNVAIQRIDLSKRVNYGYGIFHFSGNRYDRRESEEFFFERSFGGSFLLSYPLSKFQRIESTVSLANSDKEVISNVIERKALLLTNTVAFVHDNSLWSLTGPIDGSRALILLGYTGDIKFSNVNYFSLIGDYRHYFRMGLTTALAFRGSIYYNEGKEARRYFMGGSWDLRGWPRWSIRGEKMWISSLEFRFPLIDQLRIKFPFVDLGFFGIRGAAYVDAGSAWDSEYRQTYGSIGFGVRMNLFGAFVLRYDIGKRIEDDFNEFQDGLFYQFFFGWDF